MDLSQTTVDFKNLIEKLEYVGEDSFCPQKQYTEYKNIILLNFLQELLKCDDISIKKSLEQIIFKKCEDDFLFYVYRSYKHYPNEYELRNKIKSIEKRFEEFIEFLSQ